MTRRRLMLSLLLLWSGAWSLLYGSARLQGHITSHETGEPLPSAILARENISESIPLDAEGAYTLSGNAGETLTLVCRHVGFRAQKRTITLIEGTTTLDFALESQPIDAPAYEITAPLAREGSPVAFSDMTGKEIALNRSVQDVPALLSELPSVFSYSQNGSPIGYSSINIRGFEQRRIPVLIDGIPQNDPEDHILYWIDYPDISEGTQDIQVQRGAGSMFYGPAAIGGSVNIVTEDFWAKRYAELSTEYGSWNTKRYSMRYSSGLVGDKWAFFGRWNRIRTDNYRDDAWVITQGYHLAIARLDRDVTTRIFTMNGDLADHAAWYGISKEEASVDSTRRRNYSTDPREAEAFSQSLSGMTNEWRVSPSLTVHSALFLMLGKGYYDYLGWWGNYLYASPSGSGPESLHVSDEVVRAWVDNVQWGWLPRVNWSTPLVDLNLGGELRFHRSYHDGSFTAAAGLPAGLDPDWRIYRFRARKDMTSGYADATWHLQPTLSARTSLQLSYYRYWQGDEWPGGFEFDIPYTFANPRVGLSWQPIAGSEVFLSYSRTSREPPLTQIYQASFAFYGDQPRFEVNPDGSFDMTKPRIKPETLDDIELGTEWTHGDLKLGLNLYAMLFHDEIIKTGLMDRFGQGLVDNAPQTRHLGLELTWAWRPLPSLDLTGNVSYSQNKLIEYRPVDYSSGAGIAENWDGRPVAGFPDLLGNLRGTWTWQGLRASLKGQYIGRQYTDNSGDDNNTVPPYFTMGGDLGYRLPLPEDWPSLELKLQGENLLNRKYIAGGEGSDYYVGPTRYWFVGVKMGM